jgi:hypothetical protein
MYVLAEVDVYALLFVCSSAVGYWTCYIFHVKEIRRQSVVSYNKRLKE